MADQVGIKSCACSSIIVMDRIQQLKGYVIDLKYTVDEKRQRELWDAVRTSVHLLKGEVPTVKRDCDVDLGEPLKQIESGVTHRKVDTLDDGVRWLIHHMYRDVCK